MENKPKILKLLIALLLAFSSIAYAAPKDWESGNINKNLNLLHDAAQKRDFITFSKREYTLAEYIAADMEIFETLMKSQEYKSQEEVLEVLKPRIISFCHDLAIYDICQSAIKGKKPPIKRNDPALLKKRKEKKNLIDEIIEALDSRIAPGSTYSRLENQLWVEEVISHRIWIGSILKDWHPTSIDSIDENQLKKEYERMADLSKLVIEKPKYSLDVAEIAFNNEENFSEAVARVAKILTSSSFESLSSKHPISPRRLKGISPPFKRMSLDQFPPWGKTLLAGVSQGSPIGSHKLLPKDVLVVEGASSLILGKLTQFTPQRNTSYESAKETVLANILGKNPKNIFRLFNGSSISNRKIGGYFGDFLRFHYEEKVRIWSKSK